MKVGHKESIVKSNISLKQCHAGNLLDTYSEFKNKIDVLSLDCFDTILWRSVAKPIDVFYKLQNHELFKQFAITAPLRVKLENVARKRQYVKYGTNEITLHDIYAASDQHFNQDQIKQFVEVELELEADICFAYQPIVALIQKAASDNKRIVIQSDTYFKKAELEYLLSNNLSEEVFNSLSLIHVSNEYKVGKSNGLHQSTLDICKIRPDQMLHIGDHMHADFISAATMGINAVHFLQYSSVVSEQQRMRDYGISLTDPEVRSSVSLDTPYRYLMSQHSSYENEPHHLLGYATLGPVFFNFSHYLNEEINKLKHHYPDVKVLFLLRDGFLPFQIFTRLFPEVGAQQVRISRYASFAASFRSADDIHRYVASVIDGQRFDAILDQLQIDSKKAGKILAATNKAKDKKAHFCKLISEKDTMGDIISSSQAYCKRLMRYLQLEAGIEAGDKLVLVDLGYSGTTQNQLTPVFQEEYEINLFGRYLISLPTTGWQTHKAGLLDISNTEERLLETLVAYVAILEQLSTTTDKSVIDFDEEGNPIYGEANINQDQYVKLTQIQSQCSLFVTDAIKSKEINGYLANPAVRRQTTLAELVRLMYLPLKEEMDYLQSFKFDLNLGTNDVYELFNQQKGYEALQQRGLFFMERGSKNLRTNYPVELRSNGLELLNILLAQHRYSLEFCAADISYRHLPVEVFVLKEGNHAQYTLNAMPTYDGFYSVVIPIAKGEYVTAANFGMHYAWLQVVSSKVIPVAELYGEQESNHTQDVIKDTVFDQMTIRGNNLLECNNKEAMVLLQSMQLSENSVWRICFRPIEGI